eukprot:5767969-Alexandrium_andersonii.AAC.1
MQRGRTIAQQTPGAAQSQQESGSSGAIARNRPLGASGAIGRATQITRNDGLPREVAQPVRREGDA